jgi:hypothetical protein
VIFGVVNDSNSMFFDEAVPQDLMILTLSIEGEDSNV